MGRGSFQGHLRGALLRVQKVLKVKGRVICGNPISGLPSQEVNTRNSQILTQQIKGENAHPAVRLECLFVGVANAHHSAIGCFQIFVDALVKKHLSKQGNQASNRPSRVIEPIELAHEAVGNRQAFLAIFSPRPHQPFRALSADVLSIGVLSQLFAVVDRNRRDAQFDYSLSWHLSHIGESSS